jgi:hypothetical protein
MNFTQKRPGDWQTIGDDMRRALIMFEEMEQPEFGTLIW